MYNNATSHIEQAFVIERNGILVEASDAFLEFSGYSQDELINQPFIHIWKELLRINSKPSSHPVMQEALLFTKSLEARRVQIQATKSNETDEIKYFISEIPDSRFEHKNMYLEQQCESNIIGVAVYTVPDMILVKTNQKYLDFLESPFNQKSYSIGQKIEEIIAGWKGSPVEQFWMEAVSTKKSVKVCEYMHTGYKKGITYWNSIITPLMEDDDIVKYVVSNTIEVTDEVLRRTKELEQSQAIKLQKDELEASIKLKDEFLYLITHEFRTPMSVVNSALQVIDFMCKDEVTEKVGRYLTTIKQNTNRQIRLVNNLLDITRINSGQVKMNMCIFDIVSATKAIVESVELYSKQKQVRLKLVSDFSKKEVYLDDEKYERIMLNLLANALKFTSSGKSVNVIINTKQYKYKNMLCISVSDEGIGIPKNKQSLIFERFGQADSSLSRHAEGTGLGLTLVKLLVEAMDGIITVESEVDRGSTFSVLLPLAEPMVHDETTVCSEAPNQFLQDDSRLIQAAAVEFSDIYF